MELFSGLILGFLGSFHCAAMCGPIALSIPQVSNSRWSFLKSRLMYNFGRIISYSFLGLVFGFFGDRIFMFGLQQSLSIGIGIMILLSVILAASGERFLLRFNFVNRIYISYKNVFSKLFTKKSKFVFLSFGVMNGFLPCGFVYIALSGAMITADMLDGSLYMMLFGLGTVPVMLSVSVFGKNISLSIRKKINKLIPVFTVVLGLLFILRGLNLGIPYISPAHNSDSKVKEELICN